MGNRVKFIESKFIAFDKDTGDIKYIVDTLKINFRRLKFYTVKQVEPTYDWSQSFVAERNKIGPVTANKAFAATAPEDALFIQNRVTLQYTISAYEGVSIALACALVVLVFSTGNLIMASICFFCILSVVTCVVGIMVSIGWTLGVIECISLTLVTGFSVDFIVHYGISYVECRENGSYGLGVGRAARAHHAFFEMGVSVLGGAMTTLGASLFLFGCQLLFFSQFGNFICITVASSFFVANFFYMALCSVAGPEGAKGNLPWVSHAKNESESGQDIEMTEKTAQSEEVKKEVEV